LICRTCRERERAAHLVAEQLRQAHSVEVSGAIECVTAAEQQLDEISAAGDTRSEQGAKTRKKYENLTP
jgi:hypothetical protein